MSDFKQYRPTDPEIGVLNMLAAENANEMMRAVFGILRRVEEMKRELVAAGFDFEKPDPLMFTGPTSYEGRIRGDRRGLADIPASYMRDIAEFASWYEIARKSEGDLTRMKLALFGDVDFRNGAGLHRAIEEARMRVTQRSGKK